MSEEVDILCSHDDAAGLLAEIRRRDKIITALMNQVQRNLNSPNNDFGLLQTTFMLHEEVKNRTDDLKRSERLLAQIIEGNSIPTFVIDAGHHITHWNEACATLTGLSATQMLGTRNVWRAFYNTPREVLADLVVSEATEEEITGQYPQFIRSPLIEGAFEAEDFFPQIGETGRWLYFTASPLRDVDGKLIGALETLQDITSRKRDEKLLEQQTEELKKSYSRMEERVVERTAELSQQLHFLKQLIEAIPGPVFYQDAQGRYLGCNSSFETFIGRPSDQLIGMKPMDVSKDDLFDETDRDQDKHLLEKPGISIYERPVRYADGLVRDVMFHKATFTRPNGSIGGLVGLMIDITDRKQMEGNLLQAAKVFDNCADGIIVTTADNRIMAINRAFTKITGYREKDVLGCNPSILSSGRHSPEFFKEMWACITKTGLWQGEIWNRRHNGEEYPEWISIAAVHDKQGRLTNYISTFSDITEHKKAEEKIQLLAFTDPLTSLPNRRLLLDRLRKASTVCAQSKHHAALFFIDLDDFKDLNDTRGHDRGDLLLQLVAQRLLTCVKEGNTVARLGGDEFVVILEHLGENVDEAARHAESVGKRILTAINQPFKLDDVLYYTTPSIGITLFGDHETTVEDLLKQADLAMYQAKASGRNALRFFLPEMQEHTIARVGLEMDLREGLANHQFSLHYQPQVDRDGRMTGAEALIRWNHPRRGLVSPADFIPLAEETGLILPLGMWVLETACDQLCQWGKNPNTAHLTLAVNVSVRQFRQLDFVEQVLRIIEDSGVSPNKLKLELTESLLLDDVDDIIAKMIHLKSKEVRFSLDDFGTGYSSLTYLNRLPLDQLKIDQSFVRDVLTNTNNAIIARIIVNLAQSLGLEVIAEGIETKAQLDFFSSHGCFSYQGFLFSRPLKLDDLERFLPNQGQEPNHGQEPISD